LERRAGLDQLEEDDRMIAYRVFRCGDCHGRYHGATEGS
jgi:hypothetical protein